MTMHQTTDSTGAIELRNDFDYRPHVLRTDPTPPAFDAAAYLGRRLDLDLLHQGDLEEGLVCILQIWNQFAIAPIAVDSLARALHGFIATVQAAGHTSWLSIPSDVIERFVTGGASPEPVLPTGVRRLRKNAVHGAYLALIDAGIIEFSPAEGMDPAPEDVRTDLRGKRRDYAQETKTRRAYESRAHVRAATHDEVLLTRLATRLADTSRATHLCAAAVAICSSTATTSEAPQILWAAYDDDATAPALDLPGRMYPGNVAERNISARTVTLDPWAAEALAAWRTEKSRTRPLDEHASILYGGNQALTSNSAQIGVDRQVRNALQIADLDSITGLTAGSLRLWAACAEVTDYPGLQAGARRAGTQPLTLHRQVAHLGERAL